MQWHTHASAVPVTLSTVRCVRPCRGCETGGINRVLQGIASVHTSAMECTMDFEINTPCAQTDELRF